MRLHGNAIKNENTEKEIQQLTILFTLRFPQALSPGALRELCLLPNPALELSLPVGALRELSLLVGALCELSLLVPSVSSL
jgi:hypothetical protein